MVDGTMDGVDRRYPLKNSDAREAARLARLQALGDPVTIRWLDTVGLSDGWHCLELGAGAGSMVRHMARRVGPSGSVTAVDRDTSQLQELGRLPNVVVVEADLCHLELPRHDYHLVHSRSVLMHLDCPELAVRSAVAALRPGGTVFFEESDGAPALEFEGGPEPYRRVMVALASRWTFARSLGALLESLGMVDVHDDVRRDPLVGASPMAEFWQQTLRSIALLAGQADGDADSTERVFDRRWLNEMSLLLGDAELSLPFTARHRVVARRPD